MKISLFLNGKHYILSNKNLKKGDKVFPMTSGITIEGKYYHSSIYDTSDLMRLDACTGFPDEPHTIKDMHYNDDFKPFEIKTSHGYGPKEKYFKIIDVIEGGI